MPLPDISRLSALGPKPLAALGARLREVGVNIENVGAVMKICELSLEPIAAPLRRYHLRKRSDPTSLAMRLFVFRDSVTPEEAQRALGELPLQTYVDAGLLARTNQAVSAPFTLAILGPFYVLSDDLTLGDDAVMGVAPTTADLCRAAGSPTAIARALDLGCGAGAAALTMSSRAKTVIATDINPRAVEIARINAVLNGLTNIEARVGDMFAPVADEKFDLIVSQPPFVSHPEGAEAATFLYGGRRGDELPLRLFRELPPFLAPGGRAIILVDWPVVDGDPIDARVRKALADDTVSLLQIAAPPGDLDEWSARYSFMEQRTLDERFERRAVMRREHFDRTNVKALRYSFNVVARTPHVWTRTIDTVVASRTHLHGTQLDAIIATSELMLASDEELLAAHLVLPADAEIIERDNKVRVVFRDGIAPVEVSRGAAMLATAANEAATVREAIASLAAKLGAKDMEAQMLAGVRQALSLGVLQAD
jgi:methylase of polypeptide subunit release factors